MRLAYFVSHPIQYQAPLLRLIASDPDIDLKVFFYSDFSLHAHQDPGFGKAIKWDIPLIEDYDCQFLDCWGSKCYNDVLHQPVAKDILKQLRIGKFDAVWVHGWSWLCSLQAIVAANKLGIPVLLRGETNGLTEPANLLKKSVKASFLRWLFKKVDRFLYVGSLNRSFYEQYGIADEKLFPFPYSVDNSYFQQKVIAAKPNREALRQSLELEAGRPIVLYAAKLIDVKRPQDLLAAYRLLSPNGNDEPEPYLLFVGDGSLRSQLEASAQATGWNSIRFLGFQNQSEIPAMYDLCDVFILPSRFEPWGLAINEVMNAGKAVVVSDQVGCAPDLVIKGENGQIFPVGDVAVLAESIRWVIANAELAGKTSFKLIQNWGFQEDLKGLKSALKTPRLSPVSQG
jgi:glycosyltransferase involved in cell wall biosynthesis